MSPTSQLTFDATNFLATPTDEEVLSYLTQPSTKTSDQNGRRNEMEHVD